MCQVFTFAMSQQWWVNALALFSCQTADYRLGFNFSSDTRKMRVEKIFFLYLHFLASENLGPFSMVLILDIILLSSFLYVVH